MSRYHAASGRAAGGGERDIGLLEAFGAGGLLPLVQNGRLRLIGGDPDEEWGELELVIEGLGDSDPLEGTQYLLKVHRDEDIAAEAKERSGPGGGPHQKFNVETEVFAYGSPAGGQWKEGFDTDDEAIAWIETRADSRPDEKREDDAPDDTRPERLPDGTRVRVRSDHFEEECEGVVAEGQYDDGWLYRIEVTGGDRLDAHRDEDGELWVCDFEVRPMEGRDGDASASRASRLRIAAGSGTALALPPGAVRLPDNKQWTNRFEVRSQTSDRVYIISQNKAKGHRGCSCPSWRTRRMCKHLEALGLPEMEEPSPIAVLAGRIAGRGAATTFRPAPPGAMGSAVQDIYRMVERATRVLPDLSDTDKAVLSSLAGVFDHTEGVELPDLEALDLEAHDLEAALLRLADASAVVGNASALVHAEDWAEMRAAEDEARAALAKRRGGEKPKAAPGG